MSVNVMEYFLAYFIHIKKKFFDKFEYFTTSTTWQSSCSILDINAMSIESLYLFHEVPQKTTICANKVET
jgi:hypothetical protein